MQEITWKSPSNIALVKYWGKYPVQMPANPSVSFTLSEAVTTTTLKYTEGSGQLAVYLDGELTPSFLPKIEAFVERTAALFPFVSNFDLEVHTSNSFPHSSGIASSASGMSALALCLTSMKQALGYEVPRFFEVASEAARLGSGSGSRSVYGPLAVWGAHPDVPQSSPNFAVPYSDVDPIFTTFRDTILLIDKGEKKVSSTVGHGLMEGHPFAEQRFQQADQHLSELLRFMKEGDLASWGHLVEREALTLHAMMLTSSPYFILMKPNTLEVIERIWAFRERTATPVYFTLDAGANVHVLYPASVEKQTLEFIDTELRTFCKDGSYLCDRVGAGPEQL